MRAWVTWIAIALVPAGCGYVGDPLPPALNIATRVADLSVVEHAEQLVVEFTIPELTTDGVVLKKVGKVELRIAEGDIDHGEGRTIEVDAQGPGAAHATVAAAPWVGKQVVIGVRVINTKGRASAWSNLVNMPVIAPLEKPANLTADFDPKGARLKWQGAPGPYRVFRNQQLIAAAPDLEFVDESAQMGTEYSYAVQAAREHAESPVSESVKFIPADRFPPAVPAQVTAVAGSGAIELVWDRNTESDLKSYRVYRASESGEFAPVGDIEVPAYSDRAVETGKRYRYRVSAIDQAGNESQPSREASAIAP